MLEAGEIFGRVVATDVLLFLAVFGGVALILAAIVGAVQGDGAASLLRGLEAGILAFAGGLLARGTVSVLLGLAGDSPGAGLVVGWAFFIWPGVIDTIPVLLGQRWLTAPDTLLWIAAGVGAFTGMMAGIWQVHKWNGLGVLSFLLDITWGLAGTTNAALVHLFNFAWAGHASERRMAAHRYLRGFAVKPGFAFTQGAVMSSTTQGPGTPLYAHEMTHVWQNRAFGPIFILSYVLWMVVMGIGGFIAGAVKGVGVGAGIEQWSYFSNPWEAWGYAVQGASRTSFGALVWSDLAVIIVSIPYFLAFLALAGIIVSAVWF